MSNSTSNSLILVQCYVRTDWRACCLLFVVFNLVFSCLLRRELGLCPTHLAPSNTCACVPQEGLLNEVVVSHANKAEDPKLSRTDNVACNRSILFSPSRNQPFSVSQVRFATAH